MTFLQDLQILSSNKLNQLYTFNQLNELIQLYKGTVNQNFSLDFFIKFALQVIISERQRIFSDLKKNKNCKELDKSL